MTGTSYNGTIPLAAATTGVDGLEAIIPIAPNTSYYHYYRSNGLVRHPYGYMGEDIDCLYEFIHSGAEAVRPLCDKSVRDEMLQANLDRRTGDYNDFWAGRDYLNDIEPMKAALLMAHAFNDWNVVPEHSVRIYEAAQEKGLPCQIFFHQGGHGGPPPMKMMNRWFTRYLHGVENGVEEDERSWIVREQDNRDKPTPYADYPHPDAKHVAFFPLAGAPEQGELRTRARGKQGKEKLVDNYSFDGESLARAEWTEHRLIYVTPELKRPVHISGTPANGNSPGLRSRSGQRVGVARVATMEYPTRRQDHRQHHHTRLGRSAESPFAHRKRTAQAGQVLQAGLRPAAGRSDHPQGSADRPDGFFRATRTSRCGLSPALS